jgi:hypothetical protein
MQFLVYLMLWLWNDYVASLITIIMTVIFTGILIVAIISELIEKNSELSKENFNLAKENSELLNDVAMAFTLLL